MKNFEVSIEQALERFDGAHLIKEPAEITPKIRTYFYGSNPQNYDFLTPFKKGVDWTFEPLLKHFPNTYSVLTIGTKFRLVHRPHIFKDYILFLEVDGRLFSLNRLPYGRNPDDNGYSKNLGFQIAALPRELSNAFYNRFDGLCILRDVERISFQSFLLPKMRSSWASLDEMAERHTLDKNDLNQRFESRFPISQNSKDGSNFFNMSSFLSTYIDNPNDKDSRLLGDYFFVKLHNTDQKIYHIKDGDYKNMRVLTDYCQAIDQYCAHIILRKRGRFDFLPYTTPFSW